MAPMMSHSNYFDPIFKLDKNDAVRKAADRHEPDESIVDLRNMPADLRKGFDQSESPAKLDHKPLGSSKITLAIPLCRYA
jgi:hypothetical protein